MEDWMLGQREAIAACIQQGFAQAERGELMDGDEAVEMLRRRSNRAVEGARMNARFQLARYSSHWRLAIISRTLGTSSWGMFITVSEG
jgi:hypothetical protein